MIHGINKQWAKNEKENIRRKAIAQTIQYFCS